MAQRRAAASFLGFTLVALGLANHGCVRRRTVVEPPRDHDPALLLEIRRQQKWASEAAAGRASPEELRHAREGDASAQRELRKRYLKLLHGAGRATWIREAGPPALDGAAPEQVAEIVRSFEQAARLRAQAWEAADEIAEAVVSAKAQSALTMRDLQRGLEELRAAAASERRIAASRARPGGSQLAPAAPPSPKPFVEAAALLIDRHPDQERALRSFPPELAADAAQIRTALTDLRAGPRDIAPAPPPGASTPEGDEGEDEAELAVLGDVRAALQNRGAPTAIRVRNDGNFVFRYGDEELLFRPDGSRLAEPDRR